MAKALAAKRGEIWMVNFNPSVGSETRKVRPAIIVGVDTIGRLPLRIVVPITEWKTPYAHFPWFVFLAPSPLNGLMKDSGVDAFQVKSVSEARFVRRLGDVTSGQLDDIASAIGLCVGVP